MIVNLQRVRELFLGISSALSDVFTGFGVTDGISLPNP